MGKVTFNTPQVNAAVTYNWSILDAILGDLDIGFVSTDAPGPGPASTGLQNVGTSVLPRAIYQPQLGQIVRAWEPTLGYGEFIYLGVPTSTAVPLGTLGTWAFSNSGPNAGYIWTICPTTAKSALPVCASVASTVNNSGAGITSNTTAIQYAWFQLAGIAQVLKTAVIHTLNGKVFVSGTTGRVMVTSASGTNIMGARFASSNSATISCALVFFDRCNVEGNIT
jgi:hypothetical protein